MRYYIFFFKVAGVVASCDHQKSKLRAVAGAEGFWIVELRVWQLRIGRKSCFGLYLLFKIRYLCGRHVIRKVI